jgi:hypothetical protein
MVLFELTVQWISRILFRGEPVRTLICFKTKHGTTEKYMRWLAEGLGADLKSFDEIARSYDFSGYDTIIVSSGTYASFMPLTKFLKRHWKNLSNKKVIAVAVGAAPADDPWSLKSYNRIPEHIREHIQYVKIMGEPAGAAKSEQPTAQKSPVKLENLDAVFEIVREANSN